jgi:hypothetical protein
VLTDLQGIGARMDHEPVVEYVWPYGSIDPTSGKFLSIEPTRNRIEAFDGNDTPNT